jgi:5-oxoprolinase (ATP-hydrolysing)
MAASTQSGQPLARIAIDRGGTFTDAICSRKGHEDIVLKVSPSLPRQPSSRHADIKLLSVDPANYPDAPTEA